MSNNQSPTDFLNCPVCLEIASNAVECKNCANIFCEKCAVDLIAKNCPICREKLAVKISLLARRMIGTLPQVCPNTCGVTSTVGNMQDHLKSCPNRTYSCLICNSFESKR